MTSLLAYEPRARPALLGLDDRTDDSLDRGVQAFHERVAVIEAAAVDAHDHLRPGRVERLALELLDRLAPDFAVQVPGARARFEARERRLVRGTARADDETTAACGAHWAERDRVGGSTDDDTRCDSSLELDLVVEEHRPLRIRFGRRVVDELERLAGQLEQQLAPLVLENRP